MKFDDASEVLAEADRKGWRRVVMVYWLKLAHRDLDHHEGRGQAGNWTKHNSEGDDRNRLRDQAVRARTGEAVLADKPWTLTRPSAISRQPCRRSMTVVAAGTPADEAS